MDYPKATTGAIIEREGKVLLTKRNIDPFRDCWCLPGGHIEIGENASDAVKREVQEETGLSFEPKFFGYFNEIFPDLDWHAVVLMFSGQAEGEVKSNEEVSEWKWASPEEALGENLAFVNKEILEAWARRKKE